MRVRYLPTPGNRTNPEAGSRRLAFAGFHHEEQEAASRSLRPCDEYQAPLWAEWRIKPDEVVGSSACAKERKAASPAAATVGHEEAEKNAVFRGRVDVHQLPHG